MLRSRTSPPTAAAVAPRSSARVVVRSAGEVSAWSPSHGSRSRTTLSGDCTNHTVAMSPDHAAPITPGSGSLGAALHLVHTKGPIRRSELTSRLGLSRARSARSSRSCGSSSWWRWRRARRPQVTPAARPTWSPPTRTGRWPSPSPSARRRSGSRSWASAGCSSPRPSIASRSRRRPVACCPRWLAPCWPPSRRPRGGASASAWPCRRRSRATTSTPSRRSTSAGPRPCR